MCLSTVRSELGSLCHCVSLNAPDQQTAEMPAFIEVVTLADDQIIKCSNNQAVLGCLIPVEAGLSDVL